MASPLTFRGLSKTYGRDGTALAGIDLDVAAGEFLTLLGPSGSGKSTLLKLLAGFETPSGGDVLIDGASVAELAPHNRDIGVVFQNYALFPHLTVAQNVAFPLRVRGIGRAEVRRRVLDMLALVRLDGLAARYPAALSGGQQQRVALARALVFGPRIILMDEPLGALDRHLREHMQAEIVRLHRELGTTTIYVTHDQGEAMAMSDRVALLRHGRIEQLGEPAWLYDRPANTFVAAFLGENNILRGCLLPREGEVAWLDTPQGVFAGLACESLAAGASLALGIRPERIALLEPGVPTPDGWQGMAGRIRHCIHMGDVVRIEVEAGGRDWLVKLPSPVFGVRSWLAGEACRLAWRPEDARVFLSDEE